MFLTYRLDQVVDRLVGGIPRHPSVVEKWQAARWPDKAAKLQEGDPENPVEAAERTVELLGEQVSEEVAGIWTGFIEHPEDGGLAIESRQIKAMFKESANIIKTMVQVPKSKGEGSTTIPLRARVAERVFVAPKVIPLGVDRPTNTIERPIHVMTAQGPRTALKRTDYVDGAKVTCYLLVLDDGLITEKILRQILTHASLNGVGTDRSQGAGTFTYTLTQIAHEEAVALGLFDEWGNPL